MDEIISYIDSLLFILLHTIINSDQKQSTLTYKQLQFISYHYSQQKMAIYLKALILLCTMSAIALTQQDCNSTHLEYFSEYYLGRQDELNITFTKIQERVTTLNNVSWRANDTATYFITNIKPKFFYLDSNQRADIVGNDTIVIEGGKLEVTFDFQWARQGTGVGGSGSAIAHSRVLAFAVILKIKDGYMLEVLDDYDDVRFTQHINITRINPDISEQDLKNVDRLINDIINVTTVKHELEEEIQKSYQYFLSQSLYDHRRIIDSHYDYQWTSSKGRLVIPYEIVATGVDIEPVGITLTYLARIKDYPTWKCEHHAPSLPLNPKVYGGVQEFITYDMYKNTLKYAIDNGHLDVELNRAGWQSRFFQFYAGDLYEVIPKVADNFLASEIVTGTCRTSSRYAELKKGGYDFLNVTLVYNCELGVNRDKVTQFQVNLTLQVEGRANQTHLDFVIVNHTHKIMLIPYMNYKIANPTLAQHMITHSLYRLQHHRVFGSGWKLYDRDYPHFIAEDNYTIVYDSTHVDPHLSEQ